MWIQGVKCKWIRNCDSMNVSQYRISENGFKLEINDKSKSSVKQKKKKCANICACVSVYVSVSQISLQFLCSQFAVCFHVQIQ